LKLPDARECERLLLEASPVGHGLRMLPFFAGERAPGWRDDATATIAGLRIGTTPMDMLQAGLESVALRLGQIYRRLAPMAGPKHRILASGGFLQSPAWVRMIASVLGKPITACLEPEATSRGVALLALEAMGAFSGRTLPVPELGTTFEPDMQSNKVYQEALQAQEDLYQRILG
jgi:gluconokinase